MKIKITTDRTWINGERAVEGKTYDVSQEEAEVLIANGFGEKVVAARKKADK